MSSSSEEIRSAKRALRELIGRRRRELPQPAKKRSSRIIVGSLIDLPCYRGAETVMLYVHLPDEVRTTQLLADAAERGKRVVVPYCDGRHLGLFQVEELEELEPGTFGVLEPQPELRGDPARNVAPEQLDLIVVPGVAFDAHGGRLGRGKAYYDGLLSSVRPDTALVALAFECQIVDEVPMQPHDVYMHQVITEERVYTARETS